MIDPGLMDDHVLWDWGDGSSAEGSVDNFGEVQGAHHFPGSGRYTVTLTRLRIVMASANYKAV